MTATTLLANPTDVPAEVSIAAGGTPGARGVAIVVDLSKVGSQIELVNALDTIKRAVVQLGSWPPASS